MQNVFTGNTPELYELFIKKEQLQYKHCGKGPWVDLPIYNGKSNDIYRVGGTYHLFRVKPKEIITKVYMHYDNMEEMVQENNFYGKTSQNMMFDNNKKMNKHLEFTFTNGKLTKVEMKDATY
jgi:hypothetical protein